MRPLVLLGVMGLACNGKDPVDSGDSGFQGTPPGELDDTFADNGKVVLGEDGVDERGRAVAIQADGAIVVGGRSGTDFLLVRLLPDGTPDSAFGNEGVVHTDLDGNTDYGNAVAIGTDGAIWLGGTTVQGSTIQFALVKYTATGTLDASFSEDGKASFAVGEGASVGRAMAVQGDGKVVLAGQADNGTDSDFAVVRVNADGNLDPSFGDAGVALVDASGLEDGANAVLVLPDDRIVLAGYASNDVDSDFAVVQLQKDGDLDNSFGTGGIVTSHLLADDVAYGLSTGPAGTLVLAGTIHDSEGDRVATVRYDEHGVLDGSYSEDGLVSLHVRTGGDIAAACSVDSQGRITVVGTTTDATDSDFLLVRLLAGGPFDTFFGNKGVETTPFEGFDRGYGLAVQSDGSLVVTGETELEGEVDLAVARYIGGDGRPE